MDITVENVEFYLLILVRMSGFIFTAPLFSLSSVPRQVKAAITVFLTMIVGSVIPYEPLAYSTVVGLATLVAKEFFVGILIGFMASICTKIITFSGQLLDMEIGFSMATVFDPVNGMQVSVSGNMLNYFVMLILLVTNLHYYLIRAIVSTYTLIPIGKAQFLPKLYEVMLKFMADFFIIGFRIVLPVFASILVVNVVLAILAKVAPSMNMFVVGFQLKIIVGLFVFVILVTMLPSICNFIVSEMKTMLELLIKSLAGS